MAAELDEEEQETGADDADGETQQHGTDIPHDGQRMGVGHQLDGEQKDESADDLALQFSIAEDETLGQQGEQEAHHDQDVEMLGQRKGQQHAYRHRYQQQVEEYGHGAGEEEAVETDDAQRVAGGTEGEVDDEDEDGGGGSTADAAQQDGSETEMTREEQPGEGT